MLPVIDYALTRPKVAEDGIVLFGYSLGAYLVARATAFDSRPAALILDDGMYSFHEADFAALPSIIAGWVNSKHDDLAIPIFHQLMMKNTALGWALQKGVWTFGADSAPDFMRRTKPYTLEGLAHKITSPTAILEGENDRSLTGHAQKVAAELKCPDSLIRMRAAEGAGEHCSLACMRRVHQTMVEWLDHTLDS